ncbi:hypothetical protein ACHHYP_05628 [Achlya hypogyna]|uniref:PX domain-containing protein n=1 Tax=Achlya hypogyna TaxID=1202772 RepID=A0A1V9YXP6_ACHHY|nr:hypothetical protein ACHHYP_05628 [Achlya hypogyna]
MAATAALHPPASSSLRVPATRRKLENDQYRHRSQSLHTTDAKAFSVHAPGEAEYSEYIAAWLRPGALTNLDNKVVYIMDVHLGKVHWLAHKRYSEFRSIRQTLLKHFSKRANCCRICRASLKVLQATAFPPKKPFYAASVDLARRTHMLAGFVKTIVGLLQVLRQHALLMLSRSGCDVTPLLRLVEEFVGLDFSRYTTFLAERGVLTSRDTPTSPRRR